MKFLLDENQSPRIAELMVEAGHDAIDVRDLDLRTSPDAEVLAAAREAGRVIISADTDLGKLLVATNAVEPSVLFLRRQEGRRAS